MTDLLKMLLGIASGLVVGYIIKLIRRHSKRSRSDHQKRIEQFMLQAMQEIPLHPTIPSAEIRILRAKLIMEEAMETVEALGISIEIIDGGIMELAYSQLSFFATLHPSLIEIADGCADISVVTVGTLSACGIRDNGLFKEVDESNLRKFGPDGYRREDGKWIKPPDWKAPDIQKVLWSQGRDKR